MSTSKASAEDPVVDVKMKVQLSLKTKTQIKQAIGVKLTELDIVRVAQEIKEAAACESDVKDMYSIYDIAAAQAATPADASLLSIRCAAHVKSRRRQKATQNELIAGEFASESKRFIEAMAAEASAKGLVDFAKQLIVFAKAAESGQSNLGLKLMLIS